MAKSLISPSSKWWRSATSRRTRDNWPPDRDPTKPEWNRTILTCLILKLNTFWISEGPKVTVTTYVWYAGSTVATILARVDDSVASALFLLGWSGWLCRDAQDDDSEIGIGERFGMKRLLTLLLLIALITIPLRAEKWTLFSWAQQLSQRYQQPWVLRGWCGTFR